MRSTAQTTAPAVNALGDASTGRRRPAPTSMAAEPARTVATSAGPVNGRRLVAHQAYPRTPTTPAATAGRGSPASEDADGVAHAPRGPGVGAEDDDLDEGHHR